MKFSVPPRIQVSRFRPSHLRRIMEIECRAFPDEAYTRGVFLNLYDNCPDLFLVARRSGLIVGYVVACVRFKRAEIVSIAVDPKYRHMGVGSAMMAHTLGKLKASSVRGVKLIVRSTNTAAIGFYRGLGFSCVARLTRYYEDVGDALRMRKIL